MDEFKGMSTSVIDKDNMNVTEGNINQMDDLKNNFITHRKKDGSFIQVELYSYDTKYDGQNCRLIISNDITQKIEYEEELKASRDQLRQLSIHLEKIREEERASIAREIHDELGQQLTGLKMDVSWLARKITEPENAKEKIAGMITLVDDTVKNVRRIASDLRPGMLDDLGLTAALDWQSHEFNKRSGINCNFHSDIKELNFDKNVSIGVFRIMQEALTNVARHANATEVSCFLTGNDKEIKLSITDNGKGMVDNNKKKTLGLLGMRERALMMNGKLSIDSTPGIGTRIQLIIPKEKITES
jgi:signal transduction histidine kinase